MARFEGERYVVARVTERDARGVPTAFWRGTGVYKAREDAERVLSMVGPPTSREPEEYEVLRVRDGVFGIQAAEWYEKLEEQHKDFCGACGSPESCTCAYNGYQ